MGSLTNEEWKNEHTAGLKAGGGNSRGRLRGILLNEYTLAAALHRSRDHSVLDVR
jgi:hypothetical protein